MTRADWKICKKLIRANLVIIYQQHRENPFIKLLEYIYWKEKDSFHRYVGWSSWELFPPSFYHYHSEEEIKRLTEETRERTQRLIDKL